jgi:hypothetical protein
LNRVAVHRQYDEITSYMTEPVPEESFPDYWIAFVVPLTCTIPCNERSAWHAGGFGMARNTRPANVLTDKCGFEARLGNRRLNGAFGSAWTTER